MKKKIIIILLFLILVSCSKNNTNEVYRYHSLRSISDLQVIGNKPIKFKAFFDKKKIEIRDSSNAAIGEYEYKLSKKGVFIKDSINFELVYSFELNKEVKRSIRLQSLFLERAKLIDSKEFIINNKKTILYHFIEDTGDMIIDSYYMEGEGFICFYKYNDDDFLYLNSPKALEVSKSFLNDSTFFAKLKLEKINEEWKKNNN